MADLTEKEETSIISAETDDGSVADPFVGSVFAEKYLILQSLGQGGFSRVYKALHIHLKKTVAIKVLHAYYASDEEKQQRFTREARTTSTLSHPNIAGVQDFGYSNEKPFIVMEFVEGKTLGDILKSGQKFSTTEIVNIVGQVCEALACAHQQGVIHRDLKPENIMLLNSNAEPSVVKVVDFGLAKVVQREGESLVTETQTGQILGTPLYMSPEQCQGAQLDARSDIYSLGCVTYELFTGSKPFAGDTALAVMLQHLNENPPSFSAVVPSLKIPAIEAVVLKAMAKEREARYAGAAEFKTALNEAASGKQNQIWSMLNLLQARSAARKSNKTNFLIVASICILGIAMAFAVCFHGNSSKTESSNQDPLSAWGSFDRSGQRALNSGDYATAEQKLSQAINTASAFALKDKLFLSLNKQAVLFRILHKDREEEDTDRKIRVAESAIKTADAVTSNLNSETILNTWDLIPSDPKQINSEKFENLASQVITIAQQCSADGDDARAVSILNAAIPKIRSVLGKESTILMGALGELGFAYEKLHKADEAEPALIEAFRIAQQRVDQGENWLVTAYVKFAIALNPFKGDAWTLSQFDQAEAMMKKSRGDYQSQLAFCRMKQGTVLCRKGRYQEALPKLFEALNRYQSLEGGSHKSAASNSGVRECLTEIATAQVEIGHPQEAEATLKKALSFLQRNSAETINGDHYDEELLSWHLRALGVFYWQQHRMQEAEHFLLQALEHRQHIFPISDKATRTLMSELVDFYCDTARYKQAEPLLKEQMAITSRLHDDPDYLACLAELGCIDAETGRMLDAENTVRQYISACKVISPERFPTGAKQYIFELLKHAGKKADFDAFEHLLQNSLAQIQKNPSLGKLAEVQRITDLAYLYNTQGRIQDAETCFKNAFDMIMKDNTLRGEEESTIIGDYSDFLRSQKRFTEATKLYKLKSSFTSPQSDHKLTSL